MSLKQCSKVFLCKTLKTFQKAGLFLFLFLCLFFCDAKAELIVNSGDSLSSFTTGNYDYVKIYGVTNNININSTGNIVYSEGIANHSVMNSGNLSINYGGIALDTTLNGGTLNISGEAIGNTVNSGTVRILSNGLFSGAYVYGGNIYVNENGNIDSVVLSSGYMAIDGNASDITIENGNVDFNSHSIADKTTINGGNIVVNTGANLKNTLINEGTLTVNKNSFLTDAQVNGGNISLSGTATDISLSASSLTINDGGKAVNVNVNENGKLISKHGSQSQNVFVGDKGKVDAGTYAISIDGLTVAKGASYNLSANASILNANIAGFAASVENKVANGWLVNNGSVFTATGQSVVNNTVVENGGVLRVYSKGTANDTVIESGGKLWVRDGNTKIHNLLARGGAILDLHSGTVFSGYVSIDKNAISSKPPSSGFDFSNLMSSATSLVEKLIITSGVHEVFNNKLISTTSNKTLTLSGGDYTISDNGSNNSTVVSGWDVLEIANNNNASNTMVKLEGDITLSGLNKNLIVGEGTSLDVSGHSPLEVTIDGNIINNGTMDFAYNDDNNEADDITTITGNYTAGPGALIVLNVEPENNKADRIIIDGDVIGNTKIFLKSSSEVSSGEKILFADVANDDENTVSTFSIWRVEGSPYVWDTVYENNKWYTFSGALADTTPKIVSEVAAYAGLNDAAFYQTNSFISGLRNNVTPNDVNRKVCYRLEDWYPELHCKGGEVNRTAWVNPLYAKAEIKSPVAYEAKIKGVDAGIDLVSDGTNKLGFMASVRNGEYSFEDDGDDYIISGSADIDMDSYLFGLYYRYDNKNISAIASIYSGLLKADISSNDGVGDKINGMQVGASIDLAYKHKLSKSVTIEPNTRLSYSTIKFDNLNDTAGKSIDYTNTHRIEAELGMKIIKDLLLNNRKDVADIFIKPSIIQRINFDDDVTISKSLSLEGSKDGALAKVEVGGKYNFNNVWSAIANASYTFSSDYKDIAADLQLRYKF